MHMAFQLDKDKILFAPVLRRRSFLQEQEEDMVAAHAALHIVVVATFI